jgi:hypothetical protein
VIETNWRATQIVTSSNDLAIVPNSVIAKSKIVNLGHPTRTHGMSIRVGLAPTEPPSTLCAVLESALLNGNRILHTPRPSVTIKALTAASMDCELYFYVSDIAAGTEAQNELFDLVYRHCAASGVRLASPPGSPVVSSVNGVEQGVQQTSQKLLDQLPIFAALTEEERASLTAKSRRRSYRAGETIIEAGSALPVLFIVGSGVLVATRKAGEEEIELIRLGPTDCFGEGSVLTGAVACAKIAALVDSVLYEITKDDLAPILKERPPIAMELGHILACREATLRARLEEHMDHGGRQDDPAAWLAERMKMLFHLN